MSQLLRLLDQLGKSCCLDSSWLLSKPSLPLARWLVSSLSWAPITESWCLPEEDLSVLIAIQLRSLELFCALISPHHRSFLWMFFLTADASQMFLQTQRGRWRYHIILSSTREQRVHFSWDVFDHSRCKGAALSCVQGCPGFGVL